MIYRLLEIVETLCHHGVLGDDLRQNRRGKRRLRGLGVGVGVRVGLGVCGRREEGGGVRLCAWYAVWHPCVVDHSDTVGCHLFEDLDIVFRRGPTAGAFG